MGAFEYLLKWIIYLIIFVLSALGILEKPSEDGRSRSDWGNFREQTGPPEERLVTLKPPYDDWKWDKNDREARISVQNAVQAVCIQAGISYNRPESYRNTYPKCNRWNYPDFEDIPWKDAMEGILSPLGLTYVMEDDKVVLLGMEDAARRAEARREITERIDVLVSSDADLPRLHDPVIIFPLLDNSGKTTEVGTILSVLGMLKATYTPTKTFNLHVPSVIALFEELHYNEAGESITAKERERIKARFSARNTADGVLELKGNMYQLTLNFQGEHGARQFLSSGPQDNLKNVPQWIACCIYEYCNLSPSPEQQRHMNVPELSSATDLFTLAELEGKYAVGRNDDARWERLLRLNPDSLFALYRYYLMSGNGGEDASLDYVTEAMRRLDNNEFLRFLAADWHCRGNDYESAVPLYLDLLAGDFRNDAIYNQLDEMLVKWGLGEYAVSLYEFWNTHDLNSYLPSFEEGDFYVDYAWHARGGGWAWTVTEEGWKKFEERLDAAEQALLRAYELNPNDPRISAELINVAIGQREDRAEMEKWFKNAIEADPSYYSAYSRKLHYLKPKWYGTREEMFAFARECAANPPDGSDVANILVEAHFEMAYRSADEGGNYWDYFKDPKVWKEVKTVFEKCLKERPGSVRYLNRYARHACIAGDYKEAVRLFDLIDRDIDVEYWGSEQNFYRFRTEAYEKAGISQGLSESTSSNRNGLWKAGARLDPTRQVSLKPPYTGWNPDKRDREDEISVRAAVGAICRQAGIAFDDEGSYDNTNPLCEQRISPVIDKQTWEAGMEEILSPVGLDYKVENGRVVLVR